MIFVSYDFCLYHRGDFCPLFWRGSDIETASKHLCEYISKKLYKIFEVDLREKLIKQVAKDLPQQSSMIFEALDNNEIELY